MVSNLKGNKKLVSNFEGSTLLPSFSFDGNRVVYCASHNGTSQIYYTSVDTETQKPITTRITQNSGNNTSPILTDKGDVIFCSDFQTGTPQIYYLRMMIR